MAAGFDRLGNHGIDALLGEPDGLPHRRGGGENDSAGRFHSGEQGRSRQAEMEGDDFRACRFDRSAERIRERQAQGGRAGRRRDRIFGIIGCEHGTPFRVVALILLRHVMTEVIEVDRAGRSRAHLRDLFDDLLRRQQGAGQRPERAGFQGSNGKVRPGRTGHWRDNDRPVDTELLHQGGAAVCRFSHARPSGRTGARP